jgi:hypothetical protein
MCPNDTALDSMLATTYTPAMSKQAKQPEADEPLPNEDDVLRRLMQMPPDPRRTKAKKGKKPAK